MGKKKNLLFLWVWDRKTHPLRFSSIGKSRDAKWWSSGQIFLSHPRTHDRFLYYTICKQHWGRSGPEVIKLFSMLNSTDHEIYPADKC